MKDHRIAAASTKNTMPPITDPAMVPAASADFLVLEVGAL